MNAYFYTLGCKVNQYESQAMAALLRRAGYTTATYHTGDASVGDAAVIVNSCTVTGESDRKLRQLLRRLRREQPQATLVLTGCMPQAFPEAASVLDADVILGNAHRRAVAEAIETFRRTGERVICIEEHERVIEPLCIEDFDERTRAFVKIEDGCDRFCSYCIIPYARGRVRSRDPQEIVRELCGLVKAGYREAVLVGINLTSYGKDTGLSLADAVEAAASVPGIERVRLGSLEPDHITDELVARLASVEKLCPQFHVALQSGCDATLKRMNRHYDTAAFASACERLKAAFADAVFTTDVMVGFPGETEEEFTQSLEFVVKMRFAKAHVFPYSRRQGTKAAAAPNQVPNAEKADRARRMSEACEAVRREIMAAAVGTVQQVLCETRTEGGAVIGYTRGYLPCRLEGGANPGDTVTVTIERADGDWLYAQYE